MNYGNVTPAEVRRIPRTTAEAFGGPEYARCLERYRSGHKVDRIVAVFAGGCVVFWLLALVLGVGQ